MIIWLASFLNQNEVRMVLNIIGGIHVSEGSISNHIKKFGNKLKITDILPDSETIRALYNDFVRMNPGESIEIVASADGCFEPTRPENSKRKGPRGPVAWKEAKGFIFYFYAGNGKRQRICSWHEICNEERFGFVLEQFIKQFPNLEIPMIFVSDGAPWIAKHAEACCKSAIHIIDWWHIIEKLAGCLKVYFPLETERREHLAKWKRYLENDKIDDVIAELRSLSIKKSKIRSNICNDTATYLEKRRSKLLYGTFSKKVKIRGSGAMESANKFVCHKRLKQTGSSWSISNANAVLKIRCALVNNMLCKNQVA